MMMTRQERRWGLVGSAVVMSAVGLFIILAVAALLASRSGSADGPIFTTYTFRILQFTLLQAALSTLLSIGLAVPVALALARRSDFPGRVWVLRLMALPMGLPVLVVALGLIAVWGRQGWANALLLSLGANEPISIYGLSGILLAHVFFNLPLACRLMVAALERQPGESWMLAASLGMPSVSVFRFVEWPALVRILPGVAALIFMLCATSFTIVLVLGGGPAATTLEVAIYQSLRFDFDPSRAIALSVLQLALTALVLALLAMMRQPEEARAALGGASPRFDGKTPGKCIWDTALIAIAVTFLLMPLVAIVSAGLRADLAGLVTSSAFRNAMATSLGIAIASGALALAISVAIISGRIAVGETRDAGVGTLAYARLLGAAASLVLLVPPIVLGTGWFLLLRSWGDVSRTAPALVVVINALMALPFVMRVLEPAMDTHRARTARLATSLGISGLWKFWHIDRPILMRPAALALSFAMALSLGDLGAIALFGSSDFVTLPWLLYSRLSSYRTADADGLALILGALCLVFAIVGTSGQDWNRSRRGAA